MTVLFVGTEDIHFTWGGVPEVVTQAVSGPITNFRSAWARCALATAYTAGESFYRVPESHGASAVDSWVHCRFQQAASQLGQTSVFRFNNADLTRLYIMGRGGQHPELWRQDLDGTTTKLATGVLPMPPWWRLGRFDMHVNLTAGIFEMYIDLFRSIYFVGDLTHGEYGTLTGFDLGGSAGGTTFSEIAWTTYNSRKIVGVHSIWGVGNGAALQWAGTKDDVDEIIVDESDANWTDIAGKIQEYTVSPLTVQLTDNVVISAVMLGARMATNPTDISLVVRTHSADFLSPAYDTDGAMEDRMNIWETNPATGLPWTKADLNDTGFNIGVASV